MKQITVDWALFVLGGCFGALAVLFLVMALPNQAPTTCPVLGVVTINDAIAIVRECEDGRIIRDYPWEER